MARSIWGGAISFGLVKVPVKLVTAVRKMDVRVHQLLRRDGGRV
jgi:DNA end-binding protein Ku